MIKQIFLAVLFVLISCSAFAELKINQAAPSFDLVDVNNIQQSLEKYQGKIIVLEWINYSCPFVKKHYDSYNMQKLQKKYADNSEVVWLIINSSKEGSSGYLDPATLKAKFEEYKSKADAIMLDADGKVGRAYNAKTTPHMYIIDQEGKLRYQGAIDSIPSADQSDIASATNYVDKALEEILAGQDVTTSETKAYGCSVKY